MQFIAQIKLSDSDDASLNSRPDLLLIFMCQNDPGMCDDWDPNSGGNAAMLVSPGGSAANAPAVGITQLDQESFVVLSHLESSGSPEEDYDNYIASVNADDSVLGKIGGNAAWLQNDDTPTCSCGSQMNFVALLEERGGGGINFGGGGIGYAFACTQCDGNAKFLWQN
jgi:hypothetical protein